MSDDTTDRAGAETGAESDLKGKLAVTADDTTIGPVEVVTDAYLRVRADDSDAPGGQLWIPRTLVDRVDGAIVRLNRERADLHDAVLAMPPGEQREFGSLLLKVRIGRERSLGRAG
ncbi:MAG: DUF2171 domain-containing protein [Dehalococcoidia bacterium]